MTIDSVNTDAHEATTGPIVDIDGKIIQV